MDAIQTTKHYTIEEYLVAEAQAEYKSEYYDGKIIAMSGGSPLHSQISVNTTTALKSRLRGKNCTTYNSDLKVQTGNVFVYPDAFVICGDIQYYKAVSYTHLTLPTKRIV